MAQRGERLLARGARRGRAALLAVLGALALSVVLAAPAAAHVELRRSAPAAGAVLSVGPAVVTLVFDDPVDVGSASVDVFDDRLRRVDTGRPSAARPDRRVVQERLRPGLGAGTYTVSWHVSSEDTHPVSGTFRFSVGHRSAVAGAVPGAGHSEAARVTLWALRLLGYVGLLLGPGLLLAALVVWPAGLGRRRAWQLAGSGIGLLVLSTVGGLVVEGIYASGAPFSALWADPGLLDTSSRTFDRAYAARGYLLVVLVVVLTAAVAGRGGAARSRPGATGTVLASSLALMATWPVVGHAVDGTAPRLTVVVNLAHLTAMTVWLGGLVLVGTVLLPAASPAVLGEVLPVFSRLAQWCVGTLVATGSFLTWREAGSWDGVVSSTYGHVLVVKLVGVAGLLLLGNMARGWVARRTYAAATAADLGVLRRGLALETLLAAVVLSLTAVLVVVAPPG